MERLSDTQRMLALVVAGLMLVVAAQFAASAMVPASAVEGQTGALGHAGFAYLTGLRTFAAAVLWNRLDPQLDNYYGGLSNAQFMLPSIRLITWLDPGFEQAYYVGQWIIAKHGGRLSDALAMTRDGVTANPKSGLFLSSYAQLLQGGSKSLVPSAYEWAKKAVEPGVSWQSVEDEFDAYGVSGSVFKLAHDSARLKFVQGVQRQLRPLKGTAPAPANPGYTPAP